MLKPSEPSKVSGESRGSGTDFETTLVSIGLVVGIIGILGLAMLTVFIKHFDEQKQSAVEERPCVYNCMYLLPTIDEIPCEATSWKSAQECMEACLPVQFRGGICEPEPKFYCD